MPTQEFALDAAGSRRVQVVQQTDQSRGNLTVLLDSRMIAPFAKKNCSRDENFRLWMAPS